MERVVIKSDGCDYIEFNENSLEISWDCGYCGDGFDYDKLTDEDMTKLYEIIKAAYERRK